MSSINYISIALICREEQFWGEIDVVLGIFWGIVECQQLLLEANEVT